MLCWEAQSLWERVTDMNVGYMHKSLGGELQSSASVATGVGI